MERPRITKEMVLKAAKQVSKNIVPSDAYSIASCYKHYMDGYDLAKELDRSYGWDLKMADVEELDSMPVIVDDLLRSAEKKWVEENNILPSLQPGTKIKQGIIDGVDKYTSARYRVKENNCTQEGRFLLVKFEDAVVV